MGRREPGPQGDPGSAAAAGAGGGVVGPQGLAGELRRHLELHRGQLAEYEAIEAKDFPPGRDSDEDRLRRLVLRGRIGLETFWLRWLEEALAEVDDMTGPPRT